MEALEEKLWNNYAEITPSVKQIKKVLCLEDNNLFNDHIAFRSIGKAGYGISRFSSTLYKYGYRIKETYYFDEKKLNGVHLECIHNPNRPKIFVSELILEEFSPFLKNVLINAVTRNKLRSEQVLVAGRSWPIYFDVYQELLKESKYAAWMYVHGYRVNHFTLNVNQLKGYSIEQLCDRLRKSGFQLNESAKTIKGSEAQGLKQASTMADTVPVKFNDLATPINIPSCYIEFAERFNVNGQLFNKFLVSSADKIFESTDVIKAA